MTTKVNQLETTHQKSADDGIPRTIATSSTSSTCDDREPVVANTGEAAARTVDPAADQTTEGKAETTSGVVSASIILTENDQVKSECLKSSVEGPGEDAASVVSMSAIPVRSEVASEPVASYSDTSTVTSAPAVVVATEADDIERMDEYIRSPQGQNAIVERSPGGRYVRFMEKLGSGASKDVYRAYDTQEGIEVAWNVVNLSGVPKTERNRIVNEVRLLERLHHHNIISFHGSWVNRERQEVNFVTEILSSGNLKGFINKVKVIRWKIAKRWALQILKGLEYLHSQDPPVIHRDLKCENIFINGTSGDLRIGDLGLSTVHRNGKVLSVLGTPEFMAPDMYEENSYDEKVDIYAFGMCLLEIFTKEIPYKECNNPAQIYKKVTRGDPPESLSRLKSRHAREFIELCLGYRDANGKYIRPTAVELLSHDFLLKRPNDDDEVEVDPPLQERAIREAATESSSPGLKSGAASSKSKKRLGSSTMTSQSTEVASDEACPGTKETGSNSIEEEEEESDRFDEMPDSEVNIRKVKVMMGRGQELKEEEEEEQQLSRQNEKQPLSGVDLVHDPNQQVAGLTATPSAGVGVESTVGNTHVVSENMGNATQAQPSLLHYLVAAAVIENEPANSRPYADDILKLVVTLPVEGQTQNVQFDFHLVEDDPVKVAKEMVAELGIPQGAVLEISETISGLACAARMKQDKNLGRAQNSQGHMMAQSQGMMQQHQHVPGHGTLQGSNQDIQQGMVLQQQPMAQMGVQNQGIMQSASHQPMPEYVNPQQMVPPHSQRGQQPIQQQGIPGVQEQPVQIHSQQMGQHASIPPVQMQPQHMNRQGNDFQGQQSDAQGQNAPTPFGRAGMQTNSQMQPQHAVQQGSNDYNSQADAVRNVPPSYGQTPQAIQMNPQQTSQPSKGEFSGKHAPTTLQQPSTPQSYGHPTHIPNQSQNIISQNQSDYHANAASSELQAQPATSNFGHPSRQHVPMQQSSNDYQSHPSSSEVQAQSSATSSYVHAPPSHVSVQSQPVGQQATMEGHAQALHYGHSTMQRHVPASRQVSGEYQGQAPETQKQYSSAQYVHNLSQGQNPVLQQQLPMVVQQGGNVSPQLSTPPQTIVSSQTTKTQQQKQSYGHAVSSQQQQQQQQQPPPATSGHAPKQATRQQQLVSAVSQSNMTVRNEALGGPVPVVQEPAAAQAPSSESSLGVSSSSIQGSIAASSGGVATQETQSNGVLEEPVIDYLDDLDDGVMHAELRKLDEDFQKNMMRAKKVFVNRMDNLQRTQHQREAQHKKTLEKHQKERAEFEKRMQQEEIEQNRRIEQLQKEWDRRRDAVRQKQAADAAPESKTTGVTPPGQPSKMPHANLNGSVGNRPDR